MSRNKFVLLAVILAALYFFLPDEGIWRAIKVNAAAALPWLLAGIIIYLFITIQLLKRAWRKLDDRPADENVVRFSKLMNLSFDVTRILGGSNLVELYDKVNFSPAVAAEAKQMMYDAMRRKRLDVVPPGQEAAKRGRIVNG